MNTELSYTNILPLQNTQLADLKNGTGFLLFLIFPLTSLRHIHHEEETIDVMATNPPPPTSAIQLPRFTTMKSGPTTNSHYSSKLLLLLLLLMLPFNLVNFFPSDILFKKCTTWYTKKGKFCNCMSLFYFQRTLFLFLIT